MSKTRRIRCEGELPEGAIRVLSDRIELAEGKTRSVETLARVVRLQHPEYGEVELSREKFQAMVKNFDAGVYGQDIFIDVAHRPGDGAAGTIKRVFLDRRGRFRGEIEWNEYGIDALRRRGFRYFSIDFHEDYPDPETGTRKGPTLLGAGLTIRPVVKRLDPVTMKLSFDLDEDAPLVVSPRVEKLLSEEVAAMWKTLLETLRRQLGELGLAEAMVKQLGEAFEAAVKNVTDEKQAEVTMASFIDAGKTLSEELKKHPAGGDAPIQLSVGAPGLSAGDVQKMLADMREQEENARKQLEEKRETNVTQFRKLLEAGLADLQPEQRKALDEYEDLITAEMDAAAVKALAERAVKMGDLLVSQAKLQSMGWQGNAQGTPRITIDESNNIKALQEQVDKRLGLADMPEARRYSVTDGKLTEDNKRLAEKVLAQFDARRGAELAAEHKMLAGGDGVVGDVDVPVVWERTVIREALYRLMMPGMVDMGTEDFATSYAIPYSYRDTTAAGRSDTRKYQGQSISRAGVIQASETAYNIPQKLAFEVSDELRYLTAARHLNWEAVAENQRNASRIIAEDLELLMANEVLHAADEYGATAVSNESIAGGDIDGTNNTFPLANFPVVRPRAVYDLQGNQVGSTTNPVTVEHDSGGGFVELTEYDGTGTQSAGNYYKLDYNLGEVQIVDEAGAVQTPAGTDSIRVSYSYTTNRYSFDTDLGSLSTKAKWNDFLYRYGLRKSVIEDDRYHMANYGLMSGTVMTQIEQAEQFSANHKRPGTDLMADGNLGRVKDVPNFKILSPGLWMADQRVIIGERGITRVRMTKPWSMNELENQKDSNGRYTGKKEAYGDQFVVVHTPTQLKRASTSIVLYSSSGRVARAA